MHISYFPVAVIKDCDQKQLKKAFTLAYSSRGVKVHHGREAYQQVTGMSAGAGSREFTLSSASISRDSGLEVK